MFLNDTFTGADGTALASHTGESGATWTARSLSNIVLTNANRARGNVGNTLCHFCSGRPASADYYVEAVLYVATVITGIRAGVAGRFLNGDFGGYVAWYENFGGAARWEIRTTGFTLLGSFAQTLTAGQSYTLRLDMVGTTIRLLVDGVERINVTDSTYARRGQAALFGYGSPTNSTGIHWESVTATSVVPTANILVADGDSITQGSGLNTIPWPTVIGTTLGAAWTVVNLGVSGQTLANMETDGAGTGAGSPDLYYGDEYTRKILVCFGGTNDIYFNADADDTAATTLSRLSTYCTNRQALWDEVVVVTMLPRTVIDGGTSTLSVTKQTHFSDRRAAFNTSVRANYLTYADRLVDVALDPTMGDEGDQADTTYYQGDGTHPTNTGAAYLAALIYAGLGVAATLAQLDHNIRGLNRGLRGGMY